MNARSCTSHQFAPGWSQAKVLGSASGSAGVNMFPDAAWMRMPPGPTSRHAHETWSAYSPTSRAPH
jgi:hypothetical protein